MHLTLTLILGFASLLFGGRGIGGDSTPSIDVWGGGAHSEAHLLTTLRGVIVDGSTGEPIPYVYLHLEEVNKTATSDRDGRFDFGSIGAGTYTLALHHIGYQDAHFTIVVRESETQELSLSMTPVYLRGEELIVRAQTEATSAHLDEVSTKVSGASLRATKGQTLSETMLRLPGFDQRSMGIAPSRPVIRGLGGERVLILRDGQSTGDVSSQSGDHAVSIDPISAEEIEIARGPSALAYGSNAIGGIVNVVQNQIPTTLPTSMTGSLDLQGLSANRGGAGSVKISLPVRDWAVTGDVGGRTGSDLSTPQGRIENTWIRAATMGLGVARVGERGSIGTAGSVYSNRYGIPPDTLGGHPDGVDIEMLNLGLITRAEWRPQVRWLRHLEGTFGVHQYRHKELESSGSIGTEYGQVTWSSAFRVRHSPLTTGNSGSFGLWGEIRDYAVFGTRTPDVLSTSLAAYWIESFGFGGDDTDAHGAPPLRLDLGLRYTLNHNRPSYRQATSPIGPIDDRTFTGLASSAALVWTGMKDLAVGLSGLHSFRPPSIEEIYSLGPHLAAYTYEIGNTLLRPERALSGEVFVSVHKPWLEVRLNGYASRFSNYLFPLNTGRLNIRYPTLYDYQYTGTTAWMHGAELDLSLLPSPALKVMLQGSLTRADREQVQVTSEAASRTPLPLIPPAKGRLGLLWSHRTLTLQGWVNAAARQNRIGEFETPTQGHVTLDLHAQYRVMKAGLLHTISLGLLNATDARYRDHLSLIKEIRPEPGIRGSVLYKVYF